MLDFLFCCCCIVYLLSRTHYLSRNFVISFALLIHRVYSTYCKVVYRLLSIRVSRCIPNICKYIDVHCIYMYLDYIYAMVTNHLRAPYGVYFTKHRTILRRPYGAHRRQKESYDFFINFLDIVRCPVNFRYYLKFHGARTVFGRVIKGKITSDGHRTIFG